MNGEAGAPIPLLFWIGRLCEEFHCLPSEAYREYLRAPDGFLEAVIEMRAYATAKSMYDHAKDKRDLPPSRLLELVQEIDFDLAAEELAGRG